MKTRQEVLDNCPNLINLSPRGKPTVRCLWTRAWKNYEPTVTDVYLVYVPDWSGLGADVILGNTDGYDDWGHILVEEHGHLHGEEYFFVATSSW